MKFLVALILGLGLLQDVPKLSKSYLQGTWGDTPNENAYFTVQGDSIYYLEDGLKGYKYEVTDRNELAIQFDYGLEVTRVEVLGRDSFNLIYLRGRCSSSTTLFRVFDE